MHAPSLSQCQRDLLKLLCHTISHIQRTFRHSHAHAPNTIFFAPRVLLVNTTVDTPGRLNALDGLNTIAITTNGLVLHRKLPKLVEAGLTHVNISLDTLMDFKFEVISRRKGFKQVLKGIDTALELGIPVKLNCVAMKGFNDDEIVDFVAMTKDKDIDIRFIEYMPFGGNKWSEGRFLSYVDMVAIIQEKYPDFAPIEALKAEVTAKAWKVPGHAGQIGFITSMSDHFCGDCNRLRMTHDGNLKVRRLHSLTHSRTPLLSVVQVSLFCLLPFLVVATFFYYYFM